VAKVIRGYGSKQSPKNKEKVILADPVIPGSLSLEKWFNQRKMQMCQEEWQIQEVKGEQSHQN
jgi:hypothetical protein